MQRLVGIYTLIEFIFTSKRILTAIRRCQRGFFLFLLFACNTRLGSDLALDEGESLVSINVDILLVVIGVVSVAAVRVLRVAIALDDAGVGWRAFEAAGTGGKLHVWLVSR